MAMIMHSIQQADAISHSEAVEAVLAGPAGQVCAVDRPAGPALLGLGSKRRGRYP